MEKRWKGSGSRERRGRSSSSILLALVLACATLITLDARTGTDSPLEPVRRVAGEAFGPVESVTAGVVRPFAAIPDYFRTRNHLRQDVRRLEAENAELRRTVNASDLDRNRLAEYDGLTRAASETGHDLVPARVIAIGSRQSFKHTVTIDAGSDAGLHADMTVLNNDGLVGRVIRVTSTTATVLLIVDADSVVGARLASSLEMGFLSGRGEIGGEARLDLDLMDDSIIAATGDVVSSWGSENGAPYVAGVPIGRVASVYNSPRDTSRRAVIEPFVNFTALDLVGVVVPRGTTSDRTVIEARERP
ncbi:rod shape-determining protein MreC [Nocardioides sp. AE5]|uniref:rod shape-determining protein MreC n=1 Tax=Nocardioides sp. AE5 TaxID=2962573 RepID=UPI0028828211|nr:rod shape-determining protein MreC [Nocardioides sp. AE5]MDT0202806.1 rod shape-determining protein MreC [Nocardioides sp. AE5]